jgi:hypothetical protein
VSLVLSMCVGATEVVVQLGVTVCAQESLATAEIVGVLVVVVQVGVTVWINSSFTARYRQLSVL